MPGIRQLTNALLDALATFEPGRYSGTDCADLAELFARTAKASEVASTRAAARAAASGEHRKRGFADASDWVARASGSSTREARTALETIKKIAACPETQDALLSGDVSLAQAAEIASAPADHEAELLDVARTSGLGRVKEVARKRRLAAIDVNELHARRQAAREVVHWKDKDLGMISGRFALSPEVGIPFVSRLDRETDRVWRQAKRNGISVTREQCAADAFERMVTGRGKAGASRADIVYVVDLNAQARGHALPGEVCHIIGGGPVPVSVVRQHAKDAFIKVAFHDGTKVDTIVHYGRRRPALLQSVLDLGAPPDFDGVTCSEPECDRRYGLQWDHLEPVANGGPTSEDNLGPKCEPHHDDKTQRDRAAGKLGKNQKKKPRGP